jgi:PqqA peptide cyclase
VEIVADAHDLGLYTNLVTSAFGLSRPRAEQLRAAGLDNVQVSIQAGAAARRSSSPATPPVPTRSAICRPTTTWSPTIFR